MSVDTLQFELERRVILFKSTTVMPNGTLLGFNNNPNNAVYGNTPGENLIYNCPNGTRYQEDDGTQWVKVQKPNVWDDFSASEIFTGADINSNLGLYSEITGYLEDSIVIWKANVYKSTSNITPSTEGDLSNAPDVSLDWDPILEYNSDHIQLNTDIITDKAIINTAEGTINRVDGIITTVVVGDRTITINRVGGVITGTTDGVRTWTFLRDGEGKITGWETS